MGTRIRETTTETNQQRGRRSAVGRASGSVTANWIESDEALSKKDFLLRVKIRRKEAKERRLFFASD